MSSDVDYAFTDDIDTIAGALLKHTTGLDIDTEHGQDTPRRFATMLADMCDRESLKFKFTTFENKNKADEMVTMTGITFYTLCNHHVVPFFGKAHIAYIPDKKLVGLSKLARTVEYFAKGLWVQEDLTIAIADFLTEQLDPLGVAVVMQAEHMCMTMRGVEMPGTLTTTSAMRGVFADHDRTAKQEFMTLIGKHL
jgi:GTP cyclohydrolase I